MLAFVLFFAIQVPQVTDTEVITATDTIPRFGAGATIKAVESGPWSSPATWDGSVPDTNDIVSIPTGIRVEYDIVIPTSGESPIRLDVIEVEGILNFQDGTSAWLNELFVLPGGVLVMGTEDEPIHAEIVITDTPGQDGLHFKTYTIDPKQYGNGIIVLGEIHVHGIAKTAFVRAETDIEAGDQSIILNTPDDWQVNDRIVIPETTQTLIEVPYGEIHETEQRLLGNVNSNSIELSSPLQNKHHGTSINPFGVERFPHIANVTRTVTFRSENPNGLRGHFMTTANAVVDINSAMFFGLGRTKAEPIDSTRIFGRDRILVGGESIHYGTNQIGRYSLHLHQMTGTPVIIKNSVVANGLKWGIVIHGTTNDSVVENNIVFNIDGAGIVTEAGIETGSQFINNLIIKIDGGFQRNDFRGGATANADPFSNAPIINTGADGSGFWLRTTEGSFVDNYVYDAVGYGFNFNGYFRPPSGLYHQVDQFAGNEVCSSRGGLWLTWSQSRRPVTGFQPQTFSDMLIWHTEDAAVVVYHDAVATFDGITIVCDPATSTLNIGHPQRIDRYNSQGFNFGTTPYSNLNHFIVNAKVSGVNVGILSPTVPGDIGCSVANSQFESYVNVAFINGAPMDGINLFSVDFLPSAVFVVNEVNALPEVVSDIYDDQEGVVVEGELFQFGDMNNNGSLDLLDIQPFVTAIGDDVYDQRADVNMNGVDDLLDVQGFVDLFFE